MSGVSIKFRPVVNNWEYASGDTQLYDVLLEVFGVPCVLDENCLPRLRAMKACKVKGVDDLISAIENDFSIEVKAEF